MMAESFSSGSGGSHLIYPKDPPGFAVLIDLDPTIPILAERIYLIALSPSPTGRTKDGTTSGRVATPSSRWRSTAWC